MSLDHVAVEITRDLGEVVFVGAYAVIAHTGIYRQTKDIDLALATAISDGELERLGYRIFQESGKRVTRTRDGIKVDIYLRDVSGITVPQIFATAITRKIGVNKIRVMYLEALLIAKLRASRPQDISDLQRMCELKGKLVRWEVVESMATPVEVSNLKTTVRAFSH